MTSGDDLQKLIDLHNSGLLTDEEFVTAKSRIGTGTPAPVADAVPDEAPDPTPEQAASAAGHRATVARRAWWVAGTVVAAFVLALLSTLVFPSVQYLAAPFLCRDGSRASVTTERYTRYDGNGVVETELACVEPGEDGIARVVDDGKVAATLAVQYALLFWVVFGVVRLVRRRGAPDSRPLAAP